MQLFQPGLYYPLGQVIFVMQLPVLVLVSTSINLLDKQPQVVEPAAIVKVLEQFKHVPVKFAQIEQFRGQAAQTFLPSFHYAGGH